MIQSTDVRTESIISDRAPNIRHENHVSIHDIKLVYFSYFCHPFIRNVLRFFCFAEREKLYHLPLNITETTSPYPNYEGYIHCHYQFSIFPDSNSFMLF